MKRLALFALLLAFAPAAAQDGARLTLDDVKTLLELGVDELEIIGKVRRVKSLEITAAQLPELEAAGASPRLLAALKKRLGPRGMPLVDRVLGLLRADTPEAEVLRVVLSQPRHVRLGTDDILRLRRAGASKAVLLALQGKYVPPGFRAYAHPFGLFRAHVPETWRAHYVRDVDQPWQVFSPEAEVTDQDQVRTGLLIWVEPMGAWPRAWLDEVGVDGFLEQSKISWIRKQRDQQCRPAPGDAALLRTTTIGGWDAAQVHVERVIRGTLCRERYYECVGGNFHVVVRIVAPQPEFDAFAAQAEQALATVRFVPNEPAPTRQAAPIDRGEILARYRESVVMIRAHFDQGIGYGTGFFVGKSGLVLTNHHVVVNGGRPARKLEVVWDSDVPKDPGQSNRTLPATLVAAARGDWPLVDIALLQVPPSKWDYKPIPMCPVRSGLVEVEDEVIALGFPHPESFRKVGRLITTNGHISRINRLAEVGAAATELDDIVLDITINKGNSGGPCIDLRTGAVIGLNTQVVVVPNAAAGAYQKLEYGRVCLIERALDRFPPLRWYAEGQALDTDLALDLASFLLGLGKPAAADTALGTLAGKRVTKRQKARYLHAQSRYLIAVGRYPEVRPVLAQALAADPKYAPTRSSLAYEFAGEPVALQHVAEWRALKPDSWWPHHGEATARLRAGQAEQALAACERMFEHGAAYHPTAYTMTSDVLVRLGRPADAENMLRQGLARTPHVDVKVKLARLFSETLKKNDAAHRQFRETYARHPEEPAIHEAYATFLHKTLGNEAAAVAHAVRSIELRRARREQPTYEALDTIVRIGLPAQSKNGAVALQAALLMAKLWPQHGHGKLAAYWDARARPELATAHRQGETALRFADLETIVASRYPPAVIEHLLVNANLDVPAKTMVEAARTQRWTWQHGPFVERVGRDQFEGGRGFAKLLKLESVGEMTNDGVRDRLLYKLSNQGTVPLSGVALRVQYLDDQKKVVWTEDREAPSWLLPVPPGGARTGMFYFAPTKEIRRRFGKRKYWGVSTTVVSARNAEFLNAVTVAVQRTAKGDYEVTVHNRTSYELRNPRIRYDLVAKKDRRALFGTKVPQSPLRDGYRFQAVVPPKGQAGPWTIPNFKKSAHLRALGVPNGAFTMSFVVADADAALPAAK